MAAKKRRDDQSRFQIESQKVLREVETKSFEVVRLTRVKYFGNDLQFIDLRYFQRGFDKQGDEVLFPTKKGVQIKEDLFIQLFDAHLIDSLERGYHADSRGDDAGD